MLNWRREIIKREGRVTSVNAITAELHLHLLQIPGHPLLDNERESTDSIGKHCTYPTASGSSAAHLKLPNIL